MSQENVEIVRRYVELLGRFMAAYRTNPGPFDETPFVDEFFECLDPEVEWRLPTLNDEVFQGREAILRVATDFLHSVDDWKIDVDEIVDAGDDEVFLAERVSGRGKGSGTPFEQHLFVALRVRHGKVAQIYDYTERAEALKAVGLEE
jgi:ketosteroid isomerase-like protein